jgi:hypothetical protein
MCEKYEVNPFKAADEQIRKIVFDIQHNKITEYFHYKEGKVTSDLNEYDRDGNYMSKIGEMHEKDMDKGNAFTQRKHKAIAMEKDCHTNIRNQEKVALEELNDLNEKEDVLQRALRQTGEGIDPIGDVLEKDIYDKAREKVNACFCVLCV